LQSPKKVYSKGSNVLSINSLTARNDKLCVALLVHNDKGKKIRLSS